jgi:hypothetical protein
VDTFDVATILPYHYYYAMCMHMLYFGELLERYNMKLILNLYENEKDYLGDH